MIKTHSRSAFAGLVAVYLVMLTTAVILNITATTAHAQTYTVLYNFGTNANDPNQPQKVTLAQGTDGNLYGVSAQAGGTDVSGAVFKVTPAGVLTVLYTFSGQNFGPSSPYGGLTLGTDGYYYGTT